MNRATLATLATLAATAAGVAGPTSPQPTDVGPVWTVDRIVDGAWAVIEAPDGSTVDVRVEHLPEGITEGQRLRWTIHTEEVDR